MLGDIRRDMLGDIDLTYEEIVGRGYREHQRLHRFLLDGGQPSTPVQQYLVSGASTHVG